MGTHTHTLIRMELKNWEWFLINPGLQKTQTYLLTNEHLPRSSPHLQANKPTAGTLDFHLLNSLPINTACPNPESTCMQLTTTCFSRTEILPLFPNKHNFWYIKLTSVYLLIQADKIFIPFNRFIYNSKFPWIHVKDIFKYRENSSFNINYFSSDV